MSEFTIHKEEYKGYNISIIQDPTSPDEFRNEDLFLVADSKNFSVEHPGFYEDLDFILDDIHKVNGKNYHVFNLFGYSLDGTHLYLSGTEHSKIGGVFAAVDSWKTREEARVSVLNLIKEWEEYLNGNVWGFVVEKDNICDKCHHNEPEIVDSCWGFYGDYKFCLEEARFVVDASLEY